MLRLGKINGVQALTFCHSHTFLHLTLFFTHSSASTNENPGFANYLVHSLGFSTDQSLITSNKLAALRRREGTKQVSDFNFAANANSVINFFNQLGFDDPQIRKFVSVVPRVLISKVDKTLEPKFKLFKDLGFSGYDLYRLVSSNPTFIYRRVGPAVDALRQVLGSDENVVRVLKKPSRLCLSSITKNMSNNVAMLENEFGIRRDLIQRYILQYPKAFVVKSKLLRRRLIMVEKHWGIPRNSCSNFLCGICCLTSLNEKNIETKFKVFHSFGWTQSDMMILVRQIPNCLMLSEATLKKKLEFLMKMLGYKPAYLASHSRLLTYSLEQRILPRHRLLVVLEEKGLLASTFYSVVTLTERKFLEKFILPFEDVVPNLHQLYLKSRGCSEDVSVPKWSASPEVRSM